MDAARQQEFRKMRLRISTSLRQRRLLAYLFASGTCVLWLAYLFWQSGSGWDESEHAHVAWLISRGKRPLDDFFQHHQPLLWHVLAIYYWAGFTGAGVLIWGRILVVLSGVISVMALLRLGRTPGSGRIDIAGAVGAGLFAGLTYLVPELFVSRPETLATAFVLVGLSLWSTEGRLQWLRILGAGALASAAFYASPRFLLLSGFFFLCGLSGVRRWGILLVGAALFVVGYTAISGFPLGHVLFNLKFSTYLQSVSNEQWGPSGGFWWSLGGAVVLSMLPLIATLSSSERAHGILLIGYLVVIFIACDKSAGHFRYSQAYAPFIVGVPVAATLLLARFKVVPRARLVLAPPLVGILLLLLSVRELHSSYLPSDFTPFELVHADDAVTALIPPGATVLVYAIRHPIAVEDAYYYGNPLFDGQDRLCVAIRRFRSSVSLPPCDFFQAIRRARPYIVDARIARAVRPDEVGPLKQWLAQNYERLQLPLGLPLKIRVRYQLLVEKPNIRSGLTSATNSGSHPY